MKVAGEKMITREAEAIIQGERQGDYGHPVDNMRRIAAAWKPIFEDGVVTPSKVALAMVALKLVREIGPTQKRDNLVDAVGYLLIADMFNDEETPR